jgi:endonuclease YncB( thermonuclease family)
MRRGFRTRRSSSWNGFSSLVIALSLAFAAWAFIQPNNRQLEGRVQVTDGDTLRMGENRLRLKGIDAPEMRQTCFRNGRSYSCGETARDRLVGMVQRQQVQCRPAGRDRYKRLLTYCTANGRDLNAAMVAEGWAVSYGREYQAEEAQARRRSAGLWAGEFERPQDWRRQNSGTN